MKSFDRFRQFADETPSSRDRLLDFLRVFSICTVVIGHYFMASVFLRDGRLVVENSIAHVKFLWIATWVFQVMPLFFSVGGFANAAGLESNLRKGGNFGDFLIGRIRRLLQPVTVFLIVSYTFTVTLALVGVPRSTLRPMAKLSTQLLWFIGVYLLVVLFSGIAYRWHRKYGVKVLAAGLLLAVLIDVVRFNSGYEFLGYLNVLTVWLTVHQFGFFYADGSLLKRSRTFWAGVLLGSYCALTLLTTFGPYPHSLVGMPKEKISNMNPPSLCILVLGIAQISFVMVLRPALTKWLARRDTWARVIFLNSIIMTVFLWHLPSLIVTVLILLHTGIAQPAIGTSQWWLLRLVWVAAPLIPLFGFVSIFSRFERVKTDPTFKFTSVGFATVAAIIIIIGVLGFAVSGLYGIGPRETGKLVFLEVGPLLNGMHLLIGLALLSLASSEFRSRSRLLYLLIGALAALGLAGAFFNERRDNNVFALSVSTAIVHGLLLIALAYLAWRGRAAVAASGGNILDKSPAELG